MVAILEKSNAAEGFKQIIDFLSDVTTLQALVDKKRIVITEEVICEILQLNDAKGVICLPNDEIFAGLARMGYEKPSTKLTFYKAFFSTQWKFFIHTILHSLSAKRTSWNEFSSAMTSALICLSSGQMFNFSNYIFESLVRNVDSSSKFYMYPQFIQLIIQINIADLSKHTTRYISPVLTQKVFANMRRVGKGFSRVETPLFGSMLAVRDVAEEAEAQVPAQGDNVQEPANVEDVAEDVVHMANPSSPPHGIPSPPQEQSSPPHQPPCLENDKVAQQLEIVKLKARVKKLKKINKDKSSKLRRLKKVGTSQRVESPDDVENAEIYNIDLDYSSKVLSMQEDYTEVQEAVEIVTTAKLMTEVVTAAVTQVAAASTPIPTAKPKTLTITVAPAVSTRRRKRVVIRDPEEELSSDTPAETPKVKDKGKGILIEAPKPMKKKDQIEMDAEYHGMKKKPQTKSEACKNMIFYLKNTEGYKMDFFKGKKYDEILPIFQANEILPIFQTKFDANMKFLFKSREEMEKENEEIIKSINETPTQKATKRRKLSEEAQEADDLRRRLEITMFEEPDGQDAIWRNQKSVHGLALVKKWKLLTSCGVHVIILSTV
nr:hypothetical protein [Tanacetum cinerariifolium]